MLNLEDTTFPVLITERLVLRELVPKDAFVLHQFRSDKEVNKFLDRDASTGIDDAQAFINKIASNIATQQSMYWVITLAGDDTLIGTICFWNFDHQNSTIELGYELMPAHQGKGIMAEAVGSVIDYGFHQMHAKAITAFPSADNVKSVALLKKFNFVIDDTLMRDTHTEVDNMQLYILRPPASTTK